MWHKCGTKILNEINEVKKSVFFFGSGIYQFSSACVSFTRRSAEPAPLPSKWGRSALVQLI
jgi:hypothetical protein